MRILRGRKLPGNALILSDTFEVELSDSDIKLDKKQSLRCRERRLAFEAENFLFHQIRTSGIIGEEEQVAWLEHLQRMKNELEELEKQDL